MKARYLARRDHLRKLLKKKELPAILITNFVNVTYLTGFSGDDSYLLVRENGDTIISDSRYTTQIQEECPGLELAVRKNNEGMIKAVEKQLQSFKPQKLGIEGDSMTLTTRGLLENKMPKWEFVATSSMVESLRTIKDKQEIETIRRSIHYAARGFDVIRATLRKNKSEIDIRNDLEYHMRLFGAEDRGFPSIVANGPRAALPHAVPTEKKVESADLLLIDWGAKYEGYISDMTRVLITGKITSKIRRIYQLVLKAQEAAIQAIEPGVACGEIDKIARDIITDGGHGRHFGHGLGHGLGLVVHEQPRFAKENKTILRPGMVVTVEPGIYLEGWGGVRIEDDILVTRGGHEVLSREVPKRLEEMIVP
jgi:Xaa-Pro aminopeptidase